MYHYVREKNKNYPFFRYLDITKFRKQLDFFEKKFGFVSKKEFDYLIKYNSFPKKRGKILLTFDDGFQDHYDFVYKELIKRNLFGIFYVPLGPFVNKKMLSVHKVHLLCGCVKEENLIKVVNKLLTPVISKIVDNNNFKNLSYLKQNNSLTIRGIKQIFNYLLDYKLRDEILDEVCQNFDLIIDIKNFYLKISQMREMQENGMIFGSHTINHPVLSRLNHSEQKIEILEGQNELNKLLDPEYKTFCMPYGGLHSLNENTLDILKNNGFDFSFNVEHRQVIENDIYNYRNLLPRFDCNNFSYGKSS